MDSVTTKRRFGFYAGATLQWFSCIGLVCLATYLLVDAIKAGGPDAPGEIFGAVVCVALLIGLCVLLYRHSTSAPIVIVDKEKLCVGKQTYQWSEMETITLAGRINLDVPSVGGIEGMSIVFKGDHGVYILDDVYANLWQVKQFIRQELADVGNVAELPQLKKHIEKPAPNEWKQEQFQKFAGWLPFSMAPVFFGVFLLVFLLVFSIPAAVFGPSGHTVTLFVLVFTCILSWVCTAQLTNYFKVSQNFLVVKNHLIWGWDVYRLEDILEIAVFSGKQPYSMSVTTKDFRQKIYSFTTLRRKTAERLEAHLKQQGVTTR